MAVEPFKIKKSWPVNPAWIEGQQVQTRPLPEHNWFCQILAQLETEATIQYSHWSVGESSYRIWTVLNVFFKSVLFKFKGKHVFNQCLMLPVGYLYSRLFHPLGCFGRPRRTSQNSPRPPRFNQEQGQQRPQQGQLPWQPAPHSWWQVEREICDFLFVCLSEIVN